MKKVLICVIFFVFTGMVFAIAPAGKSSLAGQVYGSNGTEIAYGKMVAGGKMYLLAFNLGYTSGSSESKVGSSSADGPKTSGYSLSLIPEYRTYLRTEGQVSPYWGIYGLLGFSSEKSEPPDATASIAAAAETTHSSTSFGAGVTVGAEYFLNKTISLSANTRILQLTLSSNKNESGSGNMASETTQKQTSLQLGISAAIYLRIYF